jgi:hypothetical protein
LLEKNLNPLFERQRNDEKFKIGAQNMKSQKAQSAIAGLFFLCMVFAAGCATTGGLEFGNVEKTKSLKPGMAYQEVENLLGPPKSSQMVSDKWVVRWSLHEYWKGWVPYDLTFDPQTKRLISWTANEQAYQQNQQAMQKVLESSGTAEAGTSEAGGAQVAAGASDPQLMQQMAASYYSYSSAGAYRTGGTERKITLCPDGTYFSGAESGYSGGAGTGGAWGTASQGSGSGTWRIQGNANEGTITMISRDGKPTNYRYRQCGRGCYYFGNTKFAVSGSANCP